MLERCASPRMTSPSVIGTSDGPRPPAGSLGLTGVGTTHTVRVRTTLGRNASYGPGRSSRVTAVVEGIEVATDHWIGGRRVPSSRDRSPTSHRSTRRRSPRSPEAESTRRTQRSTAARRGFQAWGSTAPKERAEVLHRDRRRRRGAGPRAGRGRDARQRLAPAVDAELGDASGRPELPVLRRSSADAGSTSGRTTRGSRSGSMGPIGVTVVITPWNAPLMLATWRVAPALAAGNAVILKPPEWAPLTASMLADITKEAGLPDGAFNVVQGIGEEAGAALTAHPGVDRIAFTGSVPTGTLVAQAAARQPHAHLARAGWQVAVRGLRRRRLGRGRAAGGEPVRQRGSGLPGRHPLIVEASMHDEFLERFTDGGRAIVQGDPREEPPTSARRSPASTSSASTGSCSARRPTVPARCSAAAPTTSSAGCTTGRRCSPMRRRGRRSSRRRCSARC